VRQTATKGKGYPLVARPTATKALSRGNEKPAKKGFRRGWSHQPRLKAQKYKYFAQTAALVFDHFVTSTGEDAAPPELGERLCERFATAVEARGVKVGRGVFGAEMEVELINDGPMTVWLDSANR
jgi:hypothetical protein